MTINPSILIVEDHRDFRRAVRRFLELKGVKAHIMEASSGEEGILIAKKSKPRIVLMDFFLDGMNGIQATQQIKKNDAQCDIIMLTMIDPKEIMEADRHRQVKAFISKGDLFEKLIPTIDKILQG